MKRHVYSSDTHKLIRIDEAEPECGKHFCDICGDCLACYWEDPCNGIAGEEHLWVVYLPAVMLSSAISHRQERWEAVNDGASGTADKARGMERVHLVAGRGDLASPRVEAAQAAHE